ncbi:DUF4837 family protein [Myroides guanonis]|uniref:DUF4837 domain-containing protein n=1 Tax=Myroides guanonis TaxID=1150112 RepID=A0A1I3TPS3_9FLAO|nr:DUF4837 family protein [Myroides guanonis]SFJ73218.1 protein of unknown function [Myroides guanonis]
MSFILLLFSCKEKTQEGASKLKDSQGEFNHLTLVLKDSLWNTETGDSIRKYLAASLDGIIPSEPLFIIEQFSPRIFVDKNKLARNLIIMDEESDCLFTLERSKYATPQNVFTIQAPSAEEMIDEFKINVDSIISTFLNFEINEMQHKIKRGSKLDDTVLQDVFGVKMVIPDTYKYVLQEDNFIWIKKDIASGNSNLLLYEVSIDRIENSKSIIENIVEVKDSIAALYVHGTEPNSFMKTDEGFAPFNKKLVLDNLQAFELKGTWDMRKSFMSGSYLCYVIRDDYFNRYLFIEGFTYNPSLTKRELLFELEAIIKTVNFHE